MNKSETQRHYRQTQKPYIPRRFPICIGKSDMFISLAVIHWSQAKTSIRNMISWRTLWQKDDFEKSMKIAELMTLQRYLMKLRQQ
jgi:hypothetical protein